MISEKMIRLGEKRLPSGGFFYGIPKVVFYL